MILEQLIELLNDAHHANGYDRTRLVKRFQEFVWEDNTISDETLNDLLSTMAYDFDFYEPDTKMRGEDPSYYGDERLSEEIRTGLEKLRKLAESSS